jgi:hypothetical protein
MRTALACTLAAGAVIAGCGGSSPRAPLAAQDSNTLRQDVSAIRAAAAASDPTGARAAAARLRTDVARLLGRGRLSSADARSILTGLGQVDGRISAEVHAPVQSTTTPTPPAPAPAAKGPPAHPKAHGHGPGKGGKDGGD